MVSKTRQRLAEILMAAGLLCAMVGEHLEIIPWFLPAGLMAGGLLLMPALEPSSGILRTRIGAILVVIGTSAIAVVRLGFPRVPSITALYWSGLSSVALGFALVLLGLRRKGARFRAPRLTSNDLKLCLGRIRGWAERIAAF